VILQCQPLAAHPYPEPAGLAEPAAAARPDRLIGVECRNTEPWWRRRPWGVHAQRRSRSHAHKTPPVAKQLSARRQNQSHRPVIPPDPLTSNRGTLQLRPINLQVEGMRCWCSGCGIRARGPSRRRTRWLVWAGFAGHCHAGLPWAMASARIRLLWSWRPPATADRRRRGQ